MERIINQFEITNHELTKEQLEIAPLLLIDFSKLPYKKLEDGNYKYYCSQCAKANIVDKNTFKKIRQTHECPICGNTYRCTTKYEKSYPVINNYRVGDYGYRVECEFDIDNGCRVNNYVQIAYFEEDLVWLRYTDIVNYIYSYSSRENPAKVNYYKTKSYCVRNDFYNYHSYYCYRKGYLKGVDLKYYLNKDFNFIKKSNQMKMIYENKYSATEIRAISLFDLNHKEEVEKYADYIMKSGNDLLNNYRCRNKKLNVFYLDYLSRNNIDLGEYIDYCELATRLGYKIDKPKDFRKRVEELELIEEKLEELKEIEESKVYDESINNRYKKLPKYTNENITIEPFKNSEEIIRCGSQLHNCIGGYVRNYSLGYTDIYHLDIDGAIKIAIEIRNNELSQAYADHNSKCPTELLEHIKVFCKSHKIKIGRYART